MVGLWNRPDLANKFDLCLVSYYYKCRLEVVRMRKTLVVHNRYAWRSFRTGAALNAEHGLQLFTIEQLAARLAGGFFQPIDHDDLCAAVAAALAEPMGDLDAIKTFPGFQRVLSRILSDNGAALSPP
jgi:hypothetical protein